MLHVDISTLQNRSSRDPIKHCNLDNRHWISPETARRLSCNASLVTVLEDDKGNVLNIGRRSRVIPPAIQRALAIRDTSCKHPGCCSSHYLDAHHIKHWAEGGETSLENLVMLCRHHHTQLHKKAYSIEVIDNQMRFISAKGKVIQQSYFPQFPELNDTVVPFDRMFPAIDKDTATSQWHGEKMDFDMAFGGLRSNN